MVDEEATDITLKSGKYFAKMQVDFVGDLGGKPVFMDSKSASRLTGAEATEQLEKYAALAARNKGSVIWFHRGEPSASFIQAAKDFSTTYKVPIHLVHADTGADHMTKV